MASFGVDIITREEIEQANPRASQNYILQFEAMNLAMLQNGDIMQQLRPQTGSGTPEGSITANLNGFYVDTSAVPPVIYFNSTLGSDTGWVAT